MKISSTYIYAHTTQMQEESIDTFGVVAVGENAEKMFCPDISVAREEAQRFADLLVQKEMTPSRLQEAAVAYIEFLSML